MQGANTAGEQRTTGVMWTICISSKINKLSNGAAVKILCREKKEWLAYHGIAQHSPVYFFWSLVCYLWVRSLGPTNFQFSLGWVKSCFSSVPQACFHAGSLQRVQSACVFSLKHARAIELARWCREAFLSLECLSRVSRGRCCSRSQLLTALSARRQWGLNIFRREGSRLEHRQQGVPGLLQGRAHLVHKIMGKHVMKHGILACMCYKAYWRLPR